MKISFHLFVNEKFHTKEAKGNSEMYSSKNNNYIELHLSLPALSCSMLI